MQGLAEFSRLILFDRRGSGASDPVPQGRFPTWEEWSVDLIAVLEAVGAGAVALFAEGEAGPLALLFAAAHPERVSKLILGNTGARFGWAEDYPFGIPGGGGGTGRDGRHAMGHSRAACRSDAQPGGCSF